MKSSKSKILMIIMGIISMFFMSGCGGNGSEGAASDETLLSGAPTASITSIEIKPEDIIVPQGTTGIYTATAYYSDGTYKDITNLATWRSEDPNVVSIQTDSSNGGFAEALAVGTTTITASYDSLISNTAKIEVTTETLKQIVVTPFIKSVANGINVQYRAIGIFSNLMHTDLTQFATFNSSNTSVATIERRGAVAGLANTLSVGITEVTAAFGGVTSNSANLEVTAATVTSLQITPADTSVPKGTRGQYTAIAYFTDNTSEDITSQSTWISSEDAIVSIATTSGNAEALTVGSTTITASFDGVTSNTATVAVTAATLVSIQVDPVTSTTPLGVDIYYTATGIYTDNTSVDLTAQASWNSTQKGVAAIVVANGEAIAETIAVGNTEITALFESVTSNTATLEVTAATVTSIQVTPANTSVPKGTTGSYTAIVYYTDLTHKDVTRQATWISAAPTTVSIVTAGVTAGDAEALEVGSTSITASFDGVTSNTANIEVTAATLVSIQVDPVTTTTPLGVGVQYTARGIYSDDTFTDLTLLASWRSSDISVATIEGRGAISGLSDTLSVGNTQITAIFDSIISNEADLNVTNATITNLLITPEDHNMSVGSTKQYVATAYYTNGSTKEVTNFVTWFSSEISIASVDNTEGNKGLATALTAGDSTTISVTYDGISVGNTATLTVFTAAVTLDSIVVTPENLTVTVESTIGYLAEGHYSNGDIVDITLDVTWASSNLSSATIEATGDLMGVATAVTSGTSTTISATLDGLSGSTTLSVEGDCGTDHPDSVYITPSSKDVAVGQMVQYQLIGVWPSGCERRVTFDPQAVWSIKQNESHIAETKSKGGLVLGKSEGTATLNAKYTAANINDTAIVNVIP